MPVIVKSSTPIERKDEWRTLPELYKPLAEEFSFQYDFAASEQNALSHRYFTEENSALDAALWWTDRTVPPFGWLNPPFSMFLEFMTKANEQIKLAGELFGYGAICCLVKADAPETKWWRNNVVDKHGHTKHEVRYLYPRVPYLDHNGVQVPYCTFPSALVIMRPRPWRHTTWVKWQSR